MSALAQNRFMYCSNDDRLRQLLFHEIALYVLLLMLVTTLLYACGSNFHALTFLCVFLPKVTIDINNVIRVDIHLWIHLVFFI